MALTKLEYELIKYTINEEPLYVLMGAFSQETDIQEIFSTLVKLVHAGYFECFLYEDSKPKPQKVSLDDLNEYLSIRKQHGENLEEYPENVPEYNFCATDLGIAQLREEDKPK